MKMTMADYLNNPAIGSSALRTLIAKTPAHYKYELENPSEPTAAQLFGTAIHQAILEPKFFAEQLRVEPVFEGKTKSGEITTNKNCAEVREKLERWHIENANKTILTQEQLDQVRGILDAISNHKQAVKLIADGEAEQSLFWKDPETGIDCKARPDFIREGHIIVDVKTTIDASPSYFQSDVAKYGYHIQAAMYLDAATAVFDKVHDTFIIVAVEKDAPYAVNCFQLKPDTIQYGRQLYYGALKLLKECKRTNVWPAYGNEIVPLELPGWAVRVE
jgi:hypothetical protein